ncbi:DASH family cryptochrome [Polynucleobacter sp. QLW-P1DATA-2]|uniref:DASH family cryptochrome n=1 Tax=unclassified Polynucleobacter TaxID=2640945 RepID=UPI0008F82355|nr:MULTISPECIES: DASH family cryptochrome [unclassified Polynucleobacter]OIM97228.1 DASH family cryptochrome [Polynucleobacter sp. QLW-P1DATA-2]OIN00032.1 DASH family cryptochrome [Polynucleobacter sp. MWH-Tro8-2-5-gr]
MTTAIYWFRNDLRLEDNPALMLACKSADYLLPIYVHDKRLGEETPWGFPRTSEHRKVFLQESLEDLRAQLRNLGSDLVELSGDFREVFSNLRTQLGVSQIYCEQIEAPEELQQVSALRDIGFEVQSIWQSSMLDPKSLPFQLEQMPDVFTQFRQQIEKQKLRFSNPIDTVSVIPPLPTDGIVSSFQTEVDIPLGNSSFMGGATKAQAHIFQYFERRLVDTYKLSRNQLLGMDYSSKFSPWLALGCSSAKSIAQQLADYENRYGANDGTYWLWFELLWRDYFRFLHFKYGTRLYQSKGLGAKESNQFDDVKFNQWISGNTGASLVDAGIRELGKTGFLSNRMRQIVASYWIYDMRGDWRAGAAWFESRLIDYDVYSNQGNWLYIAGKGTDPRGGRPFNMDKQAKDHDPDGVYQRTWLSQIK